MQATDAQREQAEGADDVRQLCASLEALLFMSGAPLSLQDLCELTGRVAQQVGAALDLLRDDCQQRAVWVTNVAGGFQLATRPQYGELVARLLQPKRFRLSRAALETLAIVAYKQPVTRPEIEDIRGVNVDGVLETLLQYELVRECGRRHTPGRPIQYATSDNFLTHFGLNSVQDLPDLDRLGRPPETDGPGAEGAASQEPDEDNSPQQPQEPTCGQPSQH